MANGLGSVARWAVAVLGAIAAAAPAGAGEGDPDPTFGDGDGRSSVTAWLVDAEGNAVEALPNGEILVAGRVDSPVWWGVAKLDAAGDEVPDWEILIDFDTEESVLAVYDVFDLGVDANGRTIVAGWVETGTEVPRPALARLTTAGAFDTTFDADGMQVIATLPTDWWLSSVDAARVLPDGRVVFTGRCGNCYLGGQAPFLLRTTAAGAPDTTFSGDGWATLAVGVFTTAIFEVVDVAANGAFTLAGFGWGLDPERSLVVRLNSTGGFDGTFAGDGILDLNTYPARPTAFAIDPVTKRIVLALGAFGRGSFTISHGRLIAITAAGAVDSGFGVGGSVDLDIEEGSRLDAVAIQGDGRVVAAGTIDATGTPTAGFLLARTTAAGVLDTTFDGNGLKRVEFDRVEDGDDRAAAATLSGGRLVVVGTARDASFDDDMVVLRADAAAVFVDGFERGDPSAWPTP